MLSVQWKIGNRLKTKLITETDAPYHSNTLKITESNSSAPATFPTLAAVTLGEPSAFDDLEHKTQTCILSTVQLDAYTAKPGDTVTSSRKLIGHAGDIMLSMGYELFFGPQDMSTDAYNCVTARFRRYVGNGDSLY